MINIKVLQLFRAGSESEAFANQTVSATAATDMMCYKINDVDIQTMATRPQTKNAFQVKGFFFLALSAIILCHTITQKFPFYLPSIFLSLQGLLIFALTGVAEREIMIRHFSETGEFNDYTTVRQVGPDGRDMAYQPLEEWEEPDPLISGSGKALTMPVRHFLNALRASYRPPWPIIRWIPGLRHAALPAPHLCPPEASASSQKDTISTLTNNDFDESGENATNTHVAASATEKTPLVVSTGIEVEDGSAKQQHRSGGGVFWFFGKK
jgi:hypothetical protein